MRQQETQRWMEGDTSPRSCFKRRGHLLAESALANQASCKMPPHKSLPALQAHGDTAVLLGAPRGNITSKIIPHASGTHATKLDLRRWERAELMQSPAISVSLKWGCIQWDAPQNLYSPCTRNTHTHKHTHTHTLDAYVYMTYSIATK
jgi:hypothetical protein